jgi:hypothetical protein
MSTRPAVYSLTRRSQRSYGPSASVIPEKGSLAAAYFLYPPKFSFYIADPTHAAQLGFILLLSVTATKAIGVMTDDRRR